MFVLGCRCAISAAHTQTHFQSVLAIYLWLLNTASASAPAAATAAAKFIRFDCNQKKLSSTLALISPRQMKRNEIQTVSRVSHLVNQFEIKLHQLCESALLHSVRCSLWNSHLFSFPFWGLIILIMCLHRRFTLDTQYIDSLIYLAWCTSHICQAN